MVTSSYSKSVGDPFSTEDSWMYGSLRDVVVVGLITCERGALGKGAKVLISECTGNLSTTSWQMKLMGRRKDRMIREKIVSRERKVEQSKRVRTNT